MPSTTLERTRTNTKIKELQTKAEILDELVEFIEDKYLGHLMARTEREESIPLSQAQKLLQ